MSATLVVHGTIRQCERKTRKSDGRPYGTEVSILTEVGATLGETMRVLVFDPRQDSTDAAPRLDSGRIVSWVVEVEAQGGYLNARFRREASERDLDALSTGVGQSVFNVEREPVEPAQVASGSVTE